MLPSLARARAGRRGCPDLAEAGNETADIGTVGFGWLS